MEKFHHFLCASNVILETDQNPLEAILSKSVNQATPRLQRILIRTFPLPFYCAIYTRIVKPSSRLLVPFRWPKLHAYQITNQLCARSDSLNQIRIATQEDDELALLRHTITYGWPSIIKEVPNVLQPY